jgi:PAS domain-containing protein
MTDTLPRLLKSYEFLDLALAEHGSRLAAHEAGHLRAELAHAFAKIVTHPSEDVRVTVAQVRFIIANLDHASADSGVIRELQRACIEHLDRIAERLTALPPTAKAAEACQLKAVAQRRRPSILTEESFRQLDLLSDRAGVLDTDFRYVFTNAANARFHRKTAREFVGRPNSLVAGPKFFETVSRPLLEQCLAGKSASCISPHPGRDPSIIYSTRFDPVLDERGEVAAILIVSRDISHIPVPPEMLAYRP